MDRTAIAALAALLALGSALAASAQAARTDGPRTSAQAVTPRDLIIEPPTLIALGFEWYVDGDENGNASAAVSYRKKGHAEWRAALPLLRINRLDRSGQYGPTAERSRRPNLLAGSIFDLEPGAEYDVRFVLADPDGVTGPVERIVSAKTRAEPAPAAGGRLLHVYPPDHKGPVQHPAFIGIMAAYLNGTNIAADHFNVYPYRVQAGDTILVHAGLYKDDWHYYATGSVPIPPSGQWPVNPTCCGATYHGTYFLTADGTADKPIVIKAAGDGEVVFDGDGNDTLFNVAGGSYHYFEGITFRNTKVAIQAGWKDIAGSEGLVVKNSRFEDVGIGVHTDWSGSKNFYIADNVFIGRHNPNLLVPFSRARSASGAFSGAHTARLGALGVPPEASELKSEYAVKVYGSGHVVAFNRIENFHDGVDHATYGVPDGWPDVPRDRMPVANDIYNNLISNVHDDCVEVDGMLYNARVLRNLCVNAASAAFSTQGPALSGPLYFVRNIAYHVPGSFAAFKNMSAAGILAYNNTVLAAVRATAASPMSDFRNNLFLAEFPEEPAYSFPVVAGSPSTDFNGYMAGPSAPAPFVVVTPAAAPGQQPVRTPYQTLRAFSEATRQDRNSRMVDYQAFQALNPTDTVNVTRVYNPQQLDFRLRAGGPAIDGGTPLATITEGYQGRRPDLGALEFGQDPPVYGPRIQR